MDGNKPRVLFVDDDRNVLDGLRRALHGKCAQWAMSFTDSGETALQMHRRQPFRVVITDMLMPGLGGLELVQRINELSPATRCIVLTGMTDLQASGKLINTTDVFRFYTKPCPREDLISGISRALEDGRYEWEGPERRRSKSVVRPATVDFESALEREVLDHLSRGIVVVDADAKPVYMNQPATALLAQRGCLSIDSQGILRAATRPDTLGLHKSLKRALIAGSKREPEVAAVTLAGSRGGSPVMVIAVPTCTDVDPEHHYAILFISSVQSDPSLLLSPDLIASMFGLTPTEARLVEKLVMGQRLETAADELGVTIASARTYLKRVQKKTGTSRQVDLVRLVLEMPMP